MIVKCARCGGPVAEEVGVEAPGDPGPLIYCSSRCAEAVGEEEGAAAALMPDHEPPKRIVVAVDGSGPSVRAAGRAVALAKAFDAEVVLVHAVDTGALRAVDTISSLPESLRLGLNREVLEPALRSDAELDISRERRVCEVAGVRHQVRIAFEPRLEAIVQAAEDADLLVVGSRGMGAVTGAVLGSLSHRLVGATDTPVMVVH